MGAYLVAFLFNTFDYRLATANVPAEQEESGFDIMGREDIHRQMSTQAPFA